MRQLFLLSYKMTPVSKSRNCGKYLRTAFSILPLLLLLLFLPLEARAEGEWPEGPIIGARAAVLMAPDDNVILYDRGMHERMYPASTTKLMTCLVAAENASMNDMVTVSANAVSLVPPDGSNIGLDPGQSVTMEQALYGIENKDKEPVLPSYEEPREKPKKRPPHKRRRSSRSTGLSMDELLFMDMIDV